MKSKGLLTASAVLLVLSGVIWWSNKKAATADKTPVETSTVKLLHFPEDQIQSIEIKKRAGETVELQRDDSKWVITAVEPLRADSDAVSSMLSTLSSLSSDRTVEERASNPEQYGLAPPAIELYITDKNKKTAKLLIGDDTPAGTAVYAAIAGDARVFALSTYKKNSFDKSTNELRDKRLLIVDSERISRMELVRKGETIEFGRSKDGWQILKPRPLRADSVQVDELIRKLTDVKMDLAASEMDVKKAVSAFGGGSLVATARLTDESGTQELQVRKNKDDYYGKSSAVEGTYKIPSDLGQALGKGLDDFRNKKLFSFGFSDPDKIELHDGAKAYSLSRSGEDWWLDGKKLDPSTLFSFLGKVRDLSATTFVDSGFGTPVLYLTVTSNDGNRVEKVLISKMGDASVAKRENEPALYELDSKTVSELQSSAAEIKPVPTPTKK